MWSTGPLRTGTYGVTLHIRGRPVETTTITVAAGPGKRQPRQVPHAIG
jgi:hypothetical protein